MRYSTKCGLREGPHREGPLTYYHKYINKVYYLGKSDFFSEMERGWGGGGLFSGVQKIGDCAFRLPIISNVICFNCLDCIKLLQCALRIDFLN